MVEDARVILNNFQELQANHVRNNFQEWQVNHDRNNLQEWQGNHIRREANEAAHMLAKEALHQTKEHVLMEDFSSCIKDIVYVK